MGKAVVQIKGLSELRRDLMRLDRDNVPKAMVEAGYRAITPILPNVRAAIPHLSGDMRGTVRSSKIRTGGSLRVGTARVSYIGPLEFGNPSRGRMFIATGRYVWPAARRLAPVAAMYYEQEIQRAIDQNGWETNPR